MGAVNGLGYERTTIAPGKPDKSVMVVDPIYFCIMGLVASELCFEVICHEAIHAGFCYAKRVRHRNIWFDVHDLDEEHVCYPAGIIAATINRICFKHDLYGLSNRIAKP